MRKVSVFGSLIGLGKKYSLPRTAKYIGGYDGRCIIHLFFVGSHGDAMALTEGLETGIIRVVMATWVEMDILK